jgi:hypothetical protein
MTRLVAGFVLAGGIALGHPQTSSEVVAAAEKALFLAAPKHYLTYAAALKAQAAAFEDGGEALLGALRTRARADAAVAEAQEARKRAGREAYERVVKEIGMQQGAWGEVAPREARDARDEADKRALAAVIEAQESQDRIYQKTDNSALRAYNAAKNSVWLAERHLCRSAPGAWVAFVRVSGRDGMLIPPC